MQTMLWLVTVYSLMCYSTTLSEATRCIGSARYTLTFKAEWTRSSHPEDFPLASGPHFSPVVGCSHKASYVMWKPESMATAGVKEVAETGRTSDINKEMDEQITLRTALAKFQGSRIFSTGTTIMTDVRVNSEYPLVSAITMIAPSPDWFIGVHDYSLCNETTGKWIENKMEYLFPYDAGTDSAPRFADGDKPTNPQESIFLITNTQEGSFKSNNPIKRLGTFTFLKTFDSNLNTSPMTTMEYQRPTPVVTSADMPPSTMMKEVPNPSTSKAKTTRMTPNTEGSLYPILIMANATSSIMSPSMIARTTMKSLSKTTNSGERSVGHLGVFVFLKLRILNLFFADILRV